MYGSDSSQIRVMTRDGKRYLSSRLKEDMAFTSYWPGFGAVNV
jgi:hypothetical protein